MNPHNRIVQEAVNQAKLSVHKFRVGAVIYKRNRILSCGYNNAQKTHPESPHPYRTFHAEFSAFISMSFIPGDSMSKYSIYVHRLLLDGSPGLAKPCKYCWNLLDKVGFKEKNIHWSS